MNSNWMITDLHIHSRFSRACSININFENLVKWAKIKGLNLLGTGDFTHPLWLKEIKEKLKEKEGLYYYNDFPFVITGEVSLIYTQESPIDTNSTNKIRKGRRIHLVILVPNLEIADKINSYLDTKGRRDYDGRPIFKISGEEFVKQMMNISPSIEIIPAHVWTPWFGIFGSMS
jgi:PHP family Zn ribbon phosphoesterase